MAEHNYNNDFNYRNVTQNIFFKSQQNKSLIFHLICYVTLHTVIILYVQLLTAQLSQSSHIPVYRVTCEAYGSYEQLLEALWLGNGWVMAGLYPNSSESSQTRC